MFTKRFYITKKEHQKGAAMKLTVREIAGRAGVSPATVSRALRGQGGMSEETCRRIYRILEQNPGSVREKPKKKAGNIGLLMPRKLLYCRNFVEKIHVFLRYLEPNWKLMLVPSAISGSTLELYRCRNEISGLIVLNFAGFSPECAAVIRKFPHVWINSHVKEDGCAQVLMGNELAGRLAARYLLNCGCRNCACLELDSANPGVAARCDGFRFEFFSQRKQCDSIPLELPPLEDMSLNELDGHFAGFARRKLFDRYDGLFLPEAYPLPALHQALRRFSGERPFPQLISGNHSPELLAGLWPRPASIDLGDEVLAEYACRELFRQIEGKPAADDRSAVFVNPKLVQP